MEGLGAAVLANALKKSTLLKQLYIKGCSDEGLKEMCPAFEISVQTLLVCCSDNYVGGLGAAVLANALKKNTCLRELYIKGNELGNEGVKAICGAVSEKQQPGFRALDAGNNR